LVSATVKRSRTALGDEAPVADVDRHRTGVVDLEELGGVAKALAADRIVENLGEVHGGLGEFARRAHDDGVDETGRASSLLVAIGILGDRRRNPIVGVARVRRRAAQLERRPATVGDGGPLADIVVLYARLNDARGGDQLELGAAIRQRDVVRLRKQQTAVQFRDRYGVELQPYRLVAHQHSIVERTDAGIRCESQRHLAVCGSAPLACLIRAKKQQSGVDKCKTDRFSVATRQLTPDSRPC
jgi:hypothetical protein